MKKNESPKKDKGVKEEAQVEDDVIFEAEIDEENMPVKNRQATLKKLKDELKRCQKEKAEYLDGWQRARSDLVNARRRYETEAREAGSISVAEFAKEILPILDSFSMAISQKNKWEDLPEEWRKGMENIYNQLTRVMNDKNIIPFSPENEQFDPSRHEALGTVKVHEKKKDNMVIEVIQEGYVMGEKLLRAPKVKVGEYKEDGK